MYIQNLVLSLGLVGLSGASPAWKRPRESNGVGVKPAMGFNNWNSGLPSSANTALTAANAFVSLGLKDVGYEYVNTDDTWAEKSRVNGKLSPDSSKWPNGIAAVASEIHGMGLKMGLYGDSGTTTCAGYPGSEGYETTDANTLAGWGIDFWKYDNCATPSGNSSGRYTTMSNALKSTGREIYYAMCSWGADSVWEWASPIANSWRVSGDVSDSWSSVSSIAASFADISRFAGPGGFNDFDMLEVGNGGLSAAEERTHFGLWAISKSPLLIGTNLASISSSSLSILKNKAVIAINQDSLGVAATTFRPSGQAAAVSGTLYPYWSGELSDGYVVALVAVNGGTTLTVNFSDVPGLGGGTYSWTEAYTGASGTGTSVSVYLASHDIAIYTVKKSGTSGTTTTSSAKTTSTTKASSTGTVIPEWGQCAGIGWTGSGTCISGTTCMYSNPYYSQCLT